MILSPSMRRRPWEVTRVVISSHLLLYSRAGWQGLCIVALQSADHCAVLLVPAQGVRHLVNLPGDLGDGKHILHDVLLHLG